MASRWRRWDDENMVDILTNSLRYETHDHLMGVPTGEGIGRSKQWKQFLRPIRLPLCAVEDPERYADSQKTTKVRGRGRGLRVKRGPLRRPGQIASQVLSSTEVERHEFETCQYAGNRQSQERETSDTVSKEGMDECGIDTPTLEIDASTDCSYNMMPKDSASDISDVAGSEESSNCCRPTKDDTDESSSDVLLIDNVTAPVHDTQTDLNLNDDDENNSCCSQFVVEAENGDTETESDSESSVSQFSKIDFLEGIREKIVANYSDLTAKLEEKLVQEDLWVSTRTTVTVENLPVDIKDVDLLDVLQAFGDIIHLCLIRNESNTKALVKMCTVESCDWIISAFNGSPYPGCSDDLIVKMVPFS